MYDKGYSVEEISNKLLLSDEAIRKHLRDYQKHKKLHINNGGGFTKLDKSSQQELSRHLEKNNYVLVKDICACVENKYGLKYTVSGMTRLLYKMDFVYKKSLVPGKLDENKQEEFKLQYKLLKPNLKANEAIYFWIVFIRNIKQEVDMAGSKRERTKHYQPIAVGKECI